MGYQRKISTLGVCAAMVAGLSGCTWLIPDDPSSLRYNALLGERHAPAGNKAMPVAQSTPEANMYDMQVPAPAMAEAPMPTPAVQAVPAPEVVARSLPPVPQQPVMAAAPVMSGLPPVDALTESRARAEMARQVPMENAMYQMAQNNSFNAVPPAPVTTGSDAPLARMKNVRRDLEQERVNSQAARDQLSRDAAAEPSILSEQPAVPPAPPAPALKPAPSPLPPGASLAPAPAGYIALPPPPPPGMLPPENLATAPQPAAVAANGSFPVAPAPVGVSGLGGFDPMAVNAAAAPAAGQRLASNSFMPQSRYKR